MHLYISRRLWYLQFGSASLLWVSWHCETWRTCQQSGKNQFRDNRVVQMSCWNKRLNTNRESQREIADLEQTVSAQWDLGLHRAAFQTVYGKSFLHSGATTYRHGRDKTFSSVPRTQQTQDKTYLHKREEAVWLDKKPLKEFSLQSVLWWALVAKFLFGNSIVAGNSFRLKSC